MTIGKLSNLESAIYRLENVLSMKFSAATMRNAIRASLAELYQVRAHYRAELSEDIKDLKAVQNFNKEPNK